MSNPERDVWLARFAAAGPKESSAEERERFALLLMQELAWGIIWGKRQQEVAEILPRLRDAAVAARDAFRRLRSEIGRTMDGLALHNRSTATMEMLGYMWFEDDGLDAATFYLNRIGELAEEEAKKAPRAHRGPRSELAVMIAMAIAWAYNEELGRWPAIGRRGLAPRKSPFDRICDEVEESLYELGLRRIVKGCGNRFTLSDPARKKGIENAKSGKYEHVTQVDHQGELVRSTLWVGDRKVFTEQLRAAMTSQASDVPVA